MKKTKGSDLQEVVETLRLLRKEKEEMRKKRLVEQQVEDLENGRHSFSYFYKSALEFLQDELKKYERKLKY